MWTKNKYKGKRFSNDYKKPEALLKEKLIKNAGFPIEPAIDEDATGGFVAKTGKDLVFGKSLSLKVDPISEATYYADPYALINRNNAMIDITYGGNDNLAGNTLPRLMNGERSSLLFAYDIGNLNLGVNYRYISMSSPKTKVYAQQYVNTVAEALAKTQAESFTNLPIFEWEIDSSIPGMGGNRNTNGTKIGGLTAMLQTYQSILQNIALIPARYNTTMSLQKTLLDAGFNRESTITDQLFGLLKKKAFVNQINSLSNITMGEYFDVEWNKQINTLLMVPSRKSNAMFDPLITITGTHTLPTTLKAYLGTAETEFWSIESYTTDYILTEDLDVEQKTTENKTYNWDLSKAFEHAQRLLSPENILNYTRKYHQGLTNVSILGYFNNLNRMITTLARVMTNFNTDMAEIRTVLEVAQRVGLNYWSKGNQFIIDHKTVDMQYQVKQNLLVNDVFKSYMASASKMVFDEHTLRWKFFDIWDQYTGVPSFDKKDGGAFITFSTRELPVESDGPDQYTSSKWLLPILFSFDEKVNAVRFTARNGSDTTPKYVKVTGAQIANNPVWGRLNPLGLSDVELRAPVFEASTNSFNTWASYSTLLISRLIGFGRVDSKNIVGELQDTNYAMSQTLVSVVDIQMDDIANKMINYARSYAPFKVSTISTGDLGFFI